MRSIRSSPSARQGDLIPLSENGILSCPSLQSNAFGSPVDKITESNQVEIRGCSPCNRHETVVIQL